MSDQLKDHILLRQASRRAVENESYTVSTEGIDVKELAGFSGDGLFLQSANLQDAVFFKNGLDGDSDVIASLSGSCLTFANLSNADCRKVGFRGANLIAANLSGAKLQGADFTDAKLSGVRSGGAKMYRAIFSRASLASADLKNAGLSRSIMDGTYMEGSDMRGAQMSSVAMSNVNMRNCNLRGVSFFLAVLSDVDLRGAILEGVNWKLASFENVKVSLDQFFRQGDVASDPTWMHARSLRFLKFYWRNAQGDDLQVEGFTWSDPDKRFTSTPKESARSNLDSEFGSAQSGTIHITDFTDTELASFGLPEGVLEEIKSVRGDPRGVGGEQGFDSPSQG